MHYKNIFLIIVVLFSSRYMLTYKLTYNLRSFVSEKITIEFLLKTRKISPSEVRKTIIILFELSLFSLTYQHIMFLF